LPRSHLARHHPPPPLTTTTTTTYLQNDNTKAYLEKTTALLLDTLRGIEAAPGVVISSGQPGTYIAPGDLIDIKESASRARDAHDSDARRTQADDGKKQHDAEYAGEASATRGGALRAHAAASFAEPDAKATEVHPLDDD
jgi:hypothetical protein